MKCCTGEGICALIGRTLLAGIFLMSAFGNKIPQFSQTAEIMAGEGMPMPKVLLAGAIVFLIAGGISLIIGYKARIGALMLLLFLILATYYFHDFWTLGGNARQEQMIHFMKNTALMGAMLIIMANGPGAMSLDACAACKRDEAGGGNETGNG